MMDISGKVAYRHTQTLLTGDRICDHKNRHDSCDSYYPDSPPPDSEWKPLGHKAKYCLSERVPASDGICGYNVNILILVIVLMCNLGKVGGMLYVAFGAFSEPLLTIGDAATSFLETPDLTTGGMCLLGKGAFKSAEASIKFTKFGATWPGDSFSQALPRKWHPKRRMWFQAASGKRWFWCLFL